MGLAKDGKSIEFTGNGSAPLGGGVGLDAQFLDKPKVDMVNKPPHYNSHPSGVECITVVEHMSFNLGNAIKYIWRADLKHDSSIEDLEKAEYYLKREIKRVRERDDDAEI